MLKVVSFIMLIGRLKLSDELLGKVLSLLFRKVLSLLLRYSQSCLASFLDLYFSLYIRVFFLKAGL
jgi:hypothetical protein